MSPTNHDDPALLGKRKTDHIELCRDADVEYRRRGTLLDEVTLLHDALPEFAVDEVDLASRLAGRRLRAPLLVTGMTGGATEAAAINRGLARVAQELGIAFGVGSQRAMLRDPALAATYQVRDVAPDVVLLGNIGAVQAAAMSTAEARELVEAIGADALCVHLNPAQEMIQEHGDRDLRGCLDAIGRLAAELPVPVIAKETGCGMSPRVLDRLAAVGVRTVDVSGAGGTTWVGVEALRATTTRTLGETLWDWGIPTAACVAWAARRDLHVIASGGIRDGLDVARAIALGADVVGSALPWLRAFTSGGEEAALAMGRELIHTVRTVAVLTGSRDLRELQRAPRVLGAELTRYLDADPRTR